MWARGTLSAGEGAWGVRRRGASGDPSSLATTAERFVGGQMRRMADVSTVILVEDDASVAAMYRLGLEFHGFDVTTFGSGEELMGSLDGLRPDVIVLDYQLPGLNGAEILQVIRTDERVSAAPVLMLSNFPPSYEGAIDRVFRYGAIAWLEKAKTPPELLALKLDEALGRTSPAAGDALARRSGNGARTSR